MLIVEDTPLVAERLSQLLTETDRIEILGPASTVTEAIELIDAHAVEGALVDLALDGGSGFSVIEHIRDRDTACLIIVLTGHVSDELRRRCEVLGADHFLHKSTQFEQAVELLLRLRA